MYVNGFAFLFFSALSRRLLLNPGWFGIRLKWWSRNPATGYKLAVDVRPLSSFVGNKEIISFVDTHRHWRTVVLSRISATPWAMKVWYSRWSAFNQCITSSESVQNVVLLMGSRCADIMLCASLVPNTNCLNVLPEVRVEELIRILRASL